MDLNQLRKYIEFYKSTGAGPHNMTHTGFNPTVFDEGGAALDWATNAMGGQGQQQDFFSNPPSGNNQLAPYVQPQQFNGQMPQRQPTRDPMRGQTMNYLSTLMGRR